MRTLPDRDAALRRIRNKLADKKIEVGPCCTEKEIAAFEAIHGVSLPSAYRAFLLSVGNGCRHMLDGFPLRSLQEAVPENASRPFMLEDAWVWEDDDRSEDAIEREMDARVFCGEMELIDIGCGMSFNLIVAGRCRGEMWCFSDVGAQPCCPRQDFLDWFERWLDEGDDVDYFSGPIR